MKIVGVIPARLESTRLVRKMLKDLAGKPLIQRTYENAMGASSLSQVIVACDDEEIKRTVESFGGRAWMTSKEHTSGTSRITEVARALDADVFINIQGDEPLLDSFAVDQLAGAFSRTAEFHVATLAVEKRDQADYGNPHVVKVVKDRQGFALYFSRSPIPCYRERDDSQFGFLKHLGIYGYSREFLVGSWPRLEPSRLEQVEKLEQLRILDNGFRIKVLMTECDSIGVDTEADFRKVEAVLKGR